MNGFQSNRQCLFFPILHRFCQAYFDFLFGPSSTSFNTSCKKDLINRFFRPDSFVPTSGQAYRVHIASDGPGAVVHRGPQRRQGDCGTLQKTQSRYHLFSSPTLRKAVPGVPPPLRVGDNAYFRSNICRHDTGLKI